MTSLDDSFVNGYKVPSMTLQEIQAAVRAGKRVIWQTVDYTVQEDAVGQWLIVCRFNGWCRGLTRADGTLAETGFRIVGVTHEVEECA